MSEPKETTDKTASGRRQLSLTRTVESGHVQQKFSHGRSKSVVVETKKKRRMVSPAEEAAKGGRGGQRQSQGGRGGAGAGGLSAEEIAKRAAALAAAQNAAREAEREAAVREAEDAVKRAQQAEAEQKAQEEAKAAAEAAAAAERAAAEAKAAEVAAAEATAAPAAAERAEAKPATQRPADAPVARAPEQREPRRAPEMPRRREPSRADAPLMTSLSITPMIVTRTDRASPKPPAEAKKPEAETQRRPGKITAPTVARDDDDDAGKRGKVAKPGRGRGDEGRVRGKLTITNAFDERQRERSLASLKRKREREKLKAMGIPQARDKVLREVIIPEAITIQELANRMSERAVDLIKLLMKQGEMHKMNDVIDADTAELIVTEFGHTPKRVSEA
ncbi:MAG: translation initiation factor IF-2 N-terminal domain-containing protein, partial [Hyphomicrobiaceae bacterium]|nr:translation initiation factor IF-2 N-terminal domain-containing protein [Hyphomicrobiaceae bacterium]